MPDIPLDRGPKQPYLLARSRELCSRCASHLHVACYMQPFGKVMNAFQSRFPSIYALLTYFNSTEGLAFLYSIYTVYIIYTAQHKHWRVCHWHCLALNPSHHCWCVSMSRLSPATVLWALLDTALTLSPWSQDSLIQLICQLPCTLCIFIF